MKTRLAHLLLASSLLGPLSTFAGDIAQIKQVSGSVYVLRQQGQFAGQVGTRLTEQDLIRTGSDGAVGITFRDHSMMSLGPDSELRLDRFSFDSTSHEGASETSLIRGTLHVKSGKLVANQPESMRIRTPNTILGVRGTEFVIKAGR